MVCRAFVHLLAPLMPAHNYTLEVLPVDSPSDAAVYSDVAFGRQPLDTRSNAMPDKVAFTTQRLPQAMSIPFTDFGMITALQVTS
jgi:hypothetical protein